MMPRHTSRPNRDTHKTLFLKKADCLQTRSVAEVLHKVGKPHGGVGQVEKGPLKLKGVVELSMTK